MLSLASIFFFFFFIYRISYSIIFEQPSFSEKPPSQEIEFPEINGKVLLDFDAEFSNMLTIFVTVIPMTMGESLKDFLGCISHLPKVNIIFTAPCKFILTALR